MQRCNKLFREGLTRRPREGAREIVQGRYVEPGTKDGGRGGEVKLRMMRVADGASKSGRELWNLSAWTMWCAELLDVELIPNPFETMTCGAKSGSVAENRTAVTFTIDNT